MTPFLRRPDREDPLWPFLVLSLALFAAAGVILAAAIHPEPPPRLIEVDLSDIQGIKEEPPPLGEPDASPAPAAVSTPAPPAPEPGPEITPQPPGATPEFTQPAPAPVPKPRTPGTRRTAAAAPGSAPGEARGTRGNPTGKAGGRGASKGDFLSTPHPEYDDTALERRYQGSGTVLIIYSAGRIVSVEMSRSTGVSYLDSRTVAWVKNYWKVRPGASGKAILPITWRIQ